MTHLQRWAIKQSAATLSGFAAKCKVPHALLIGGILKVMCASCCCREMWIKHYSSQIISWSNKSSSSESFPPELRSVYENSTKGPFQPIFALFAQQHLAVYPPCVCSVAAAYIHLYNIEEVLVLLLMIQYVMTCFHGRDTRVQRYEYIKGFVFCTSRFKLVCFKLNFGCQSRDYSQGFIWVYHSAGVITSDLHTCNKDWSQSEYMCIFWMQMHFSTTQATIF